MPNSLAEVLRLLRDLPPRTSLDAAELYAWLEPLVHVDVAGSRDSAAGTVVDLTVAQVAALVGRGESTVRTWLADGRLPGAYRLRGREWRVPVAAIQAMQAAEAKRHRSETDAARAPKRAAGAAPDLGAWRGHLPSGGGAGAAR